MTSKEYLNSIRIMTLKLNQKAKELEELRLITPGMTATASGERVQSSRNNDPVGSHAAKIADIAVMIEKEKADLIEKKHTIINQIQGIENPNYIDILFRRYVLFQNFNQISYEIGYTYQWTIEMHGHALQTFEKTYANLF